MRHSSAIHTEKSSPVGKDLNAFPYWLTRKIKGLSPKALKERKSDP